MSFLLSSCADYYNNIYHTKHGDDGKGHFKGEGWKEEDEAVCFVNGEKCLCVKYYEKSKQYTLSMFWAPESYSSPGVADTINNIYRFIVSPSNRFCTNLPDCQVWGMQMTVWMEGRRIPESGKAYELISLDSWEYYPNGTYLQEYYNYRQIPQKTPFADVRFVDQDDTVFVAESGSVSFEIDWNSLFIKKVTINMEARNSAGETIRVSGCEVMNLGYKPGHFATGSLLDPIHYD